MSGIPRMDAPDLLKARSHPTRQDILRVMREADEPMSATGVGRALQARGRLDDRNHLYYHFRALANAGFLALVSQRRVRSAVESFYEIAEDVEIKIADTAALDDIAARIQRKGSAPDLLSEITKLVQATGRIPVRRKTKPTITPASQQEQKLASAPRVRVTCECGRGPTDSEGGCLSCGKPREEVAAQWS